ncbi:hypothetical protein WC7_03564 [Citrobacter sp. KTE151]|nr:hypothetical protein WC7_03564 [Citrobacter sp. KTE151]NCL82529.1 ORF6N domain-containing protein [Citrobacter braakii]
MNKRKNVDDEVKCGGMSTMSTGEGLPIIEWAGVRVVTSEQLADGYSTGVENIRRNFNRNKSRFVEGTHYFQISGGELENLRGSFSPAQISTRTRSLTLWTERGAR